MALPRATSLAWCETAPPPSHYREGDSPEAMRSPEAARCRSALCRSLTATTETWASPWNAASRQCRGCRPSPPHHAAGACSRDLCGRSPPSRVRSTSTRPSTRLVSKASFSLPHHRDCLEERVDDEQSGRGCFRALRIQGPCGRLKRALAAHHPAHPGPSRSLCADGWRRRASQASAGVHTACRHHCVQEQVHSNTGGHLTAFAASWHAADTPRSYHAPLPGRSAQPTLSSGPSR